MVMEVAPLALKYLNSARYVYRNDFQKCECETQEGVG